MNADIANCCGSMFKLAKWNAPKQTASVAERMHSICARLDQPLNDQCSHHIETSQMSCSANQLVGFYMIETLIVKGLKRNIKFFLAMTKMTLILKSVFLHFGSCLFYMKKLALLNILFCWQTKHNYSDPALNIPNLIKAGCRSEYFTSW